MGELGLSWAEKFSILGWNPNKFQEQIEKYKGNTTKEPIYGVLSTGDRIGEIIGVSYSKVDNEKRIETTILGFTIGGDNSISQREIITPKNRIAGNLFITPKNFIICGKVNHIISFTKVFSTVGSRNTKTASDYELNKLGVVEYSYVDDIYISRIKMNKQIDLETGYDEFTIAIVIGSTKQNPIEVTWMQMERMISL
jgi:hypothetical protein